MANCIVCGKKSFFLETKWKNHKIAGLPSIVQGCKECSICSVCGKKLRECKELLIGYGPKFYCKEHHLLATNLCSRCGQEKPNQGTSVFDDEIICKDCGKCTICGKSDKEITRIKKGSTIYCQEHKDQIDTIPNQREELMQARSKLQIEYRKLVKPSKIELLHGLTNPTSATNLSVQKNTNIQIIQRKIDKLDEQIKNLDNDNKSKNELTNSPEKNEDSASDPIQILKLRFANGEISKKEYQEIIDVMQDD